jgi:Notch-like protein
LSCGTVEATNSFDTHAKCYAVDSSTLKCTVRATNGVAALGCMARGACSSYTIED